MFAAHATENALVLSADMIASLASMPEQFERLYRLVPASYATWKPESWEGVPGEMFSALEQACHLRDIEIDGYQARLRRTRQETRPLLASLDGYALAEERRYREADPAQVLAAFREARSATLEQIRHIGTDELSRPATFEGYGDITLKSLIHFLCSHDQQHLSCMHWLLGKIDSHRALGS